MPALTIEDKKCLSRLHSVLCACGSGKQPGRSFCRSCYFALPADLRKALYNRVGEGYAQAHQAAIDKLCELGRVKPHD